MAPVLRRLIVSLAACLMLVGLTPDAAIAVSGPHSGMFLWGEPDADFGKDAIFNVMPPADTIEITEQSANLVRVQGRPPSPGSPWTLIFAAPLGEDLIVGTYTGTRQAQFNRPAGVPGLSISGEGRGCTDPRGEFTVHELVRDGGGLVTQLSARFASTCDQPGAGLLHGEVRFQSSQPLVAWSKSLGPYSGFEYGQHVVGSEAATRPVWLTNTGSLPVTIHASIIGAQASDFEIVDDDGCLGELQVEETCQIGVRFRPVSIGEREATIRFADTHYGARQNVRLVGQGMATTQTRVISVTGTYPQGATVNGTLDPADAGLRLSFSVDGNHPLHETLSHTSARLWAGPGWHDFATTVGGSGYYLPSSSERVRHMLPVGTVTSLSATPNAPRVGESVSLHAAVRWWGSYVPSGGTLTIVDLTTGATIAETLVTRTNWDVSAVVRAFVPGSRTYEARYSGHGLLAPSAAGSSPTFGAASGDTKAPEGTIQINGGATSTGTTSVTLNLAAFDPPSGSGIAGMQFSDTGAPGSWTPWEAYATSRPWTLSGADGTKSVFARYRDGAGNLSVPVGASIQLSRTGPVLSAAPSVALGVGATSDATVPLIVTTRVGSVGEAVTTMVVQRQTNSNAWVQVYSGVPTEVIALALAPGASSHRLRTRVVDENGIASPWKVGERFQVSRVQEANSGVTYSGTWKRLSAAQASGGKFRQSSAAGATARYTFTGREVGLIGRFGPDAGRARITIDGTIVATIDMYRPKVAWRRISLAVPAALGPHQLEVRVLRQKTASSTGYKVAVDAFVVIR